MFLEQSVLLVSRQEAKPNAILLLWYLYVHESESESHSVVSDSLWLRGLYSSWNSLGQNTGVGSLSLLQGLFPTQGSNPGLPHCRWILYQLSHKGIPFMFIDKFNECPQDLKMGVGKIIFKWFWLLTPELSFHFLLYGMAGFPDPW